MIILAMQFLWKRVSCNLGKLREEVIFSSFLTNLPGDNELKQTAPQGFQLLKANYLNDLYILLVRKLTGFTETIQLYDM